MGTTDFALILTLLVCESDLVGFVSFLVSFALATVLLFVAFPFATLPCALFFPCAVLPLLALVLPFALATFETLFVSLVFVAFATFEGFAERAFTVSFTFDPVRDAELLELLTSDASLRTVLAFPPPPAIFFLVALLASPRATPFTSKFATVI
jgi:hypothetical protein